MKPRHPAAITPQTLYPYLLQENMVREVSLESKKQMTQKQDSWHISGNKELGLGQ